MTAPNSLDLLPQRHHRRRVEEHDHLPKSASNIETTRRKIMSVFVHFFDVRDILALRRDLETRITFVSEQPKLS